jgi:hypothetical protein
MAHLELYHLALATKGEALWNFNEHLTFIPTPVTIVLKYSKKEATMHKREPQ